MAETVTVRLPKVFLRLTPRAGYLTVAVGRHPYILLWPAVRRLYQALGQLLDQWDPSAPMNGNGSRPRPDQPPDPTRQEA